MLRKVVEIAHEFRDRVRAEVPGASQTSDAAIQDHMVALLADLAQTLVLLEHPVEDVDDLLRDGSAILRTVADRGGATEERAEDPERAIEVLAGMLEQARRGSLRAFRMAGRAAGRVKGGMR